MFHGVPLPFVVPRRGRTRLHRAFARLLLLPQSLDLAAKRSDAQSAPEEHLANLRHRILSRYY